MRDKVDIKWLDETDSTQDEVRRHILDYDNMSVVAAEFQTAGRGQRGNKWHARKGENLTFSMLLKFGEKGFPAISAAGQFIITKAATLGVSSYLESIGIESSIKWPNDIYVRNKKICGMLIENILDGDEVTVSIVGIGLNINQTEFPINLSNPTSAKALTGKEYDLREELSSLGGYLSDAFDKVLTDKEVESADEAYESRLYRKGEFHEYTLCSDGSKLECEIIGVSPSGKLRVLNKKGELNEFAFKEISYII